MAESGLQAIRRRFRTPLGCALATALQIWSLPLHAQDCRTTPTTDCLLNKAVTLWENLAPDADGRVESGAELAYEAARYHNRFQPDIPPDARQALTTTLEREDRFVDALKQQKFTQAENALPTLNPVSHDSFTVAPPALLIEYLILHLHDREAEQIKRKYYEKLVGLDNGSRARSMLEVARHEMLGGQPDKGRHTLANADIDDFSESELVGEKAAADFLATQSEQLFLHPEQQTPDCNSPPGVAMALQHYLQNPAFSSPKELSFIGSPSLRIQTHLLSAHLLHNSQQCPLLEKWLIAGAIQDTAQSADAKPDADAIIKLVYLARTIRRYFQ